MVAMDAHHERLLKLVSEARKQLGLDKQADLIKASGLSRSTVRRFEQGESIDESSLRKISRAIHWTPDSAQDVLNGGDPTPAKPTAADPSKAALEARYQNRESVIDAGHAVATVEDALYRFFMAGAPDTTLADFDRVRRRVFDVFQEEGISIAKRHDETSAGTDPHA